MNLLFRSLIFLLVIVFLILFSNFTLAADTSTNETNTFIGNVKGVLDWVNVFYSWAIVLISFIALVVLGIGGIRWLTSKGNPDMIKSAKTYIMSALTGLVILLFSHLILKIIDPRLVKLNLNIPEPEFVSCEDFTSQSECEKADCQWKDKKCQEPVPAGTPGSKCDKEGTYIDYTDNNTGLIISLICDTSVWEWRIREQGICYYQKTDGTVFEGECITGAECKSFCSKGGLSGGCQEGVERIDKCR